MEKICRKCKTPKLITEYYKNKRSKDGFNYICKCCCYELGVLSRIKNKEKYKRQNKIWNNNNIDKKKGYEQKRKNNPDRIKYRQEYYQKVKEKRKNTYEKSENRKLYRKKYNKESIYMIWRQVLRGVIKRIGNKKEQKTIDILGYSAHQFKLHIENLFLPGMYWENHGEWHIDHIIPISKFSKDTPLSVINGLENLQPLWAKDNIKKSNKII